MPVKNTEPLSQVISAPWDQNWISKNSAAIAPVVYQKMYKNYGMGAEMFEMLNIAERKINVPNADVTTFERQFPENALRIRDQVATNNAGDDISIVLHGDNFDTNSNSVARIGDVIYISPLYVAGNVARGYRIMSLSTTTITNDTLACEPLSADSNTITGTQITTAVPAGTLISAPGPNIHTHGSGQPASLNDSWATRFHRAAILKGTVRIEGGVNAKEYYEPVKVDMGGGTLGVMSKATIQAEFDLDSQQDFQILLGEQNDNSNLVETSDFSGSQTIPSGYGIWQWADQLAQDMPYSGTFDYNDFYDFGKKFESQAVVAGGALFCMGPELGRYVEQAGLEYVKEFSGGTDLLDKAIDKLGFTVNRVRINDIEYALKTMKSWANPTKLGLVQNSTYAYEFPTGGLVIPQEYVDTKFSGAGSMEMKTIPNLTLAYVNNGGENRERIMKWNPGVTNIYDFPFAANDKDGINGYWLTEMMVIVGEVNKWIKVRST